ncbi:hypothetical protein ER57_10625 [Smithella sp. SCADC]|jgi:hypothetical protein|nr:hypothetical protein ER57_10625 [Smithella sp. SCADC]
MTKGGAELKAQKKTVIPPGTLTVTEPDEVPPAARAATDRVPLSSTELLVFDLVVDRECFVVEATDDAVPWFFVVSVMEKLREDAVMVVALLLTTEMIRSVVPATLIVTVRNVEDAGMVNAVTVGAVLSPEALPAHAIFKI